MFRSMFKGGPFSALRGVLDTLLTAGHTRLQLLGNEIQTEKHRALHQLALLGMALICAAVALCLAVVLVLVLWWDERVVVLSGLLVLFLGGAIVAGLAMRKVGQRDTHIFASSLAELQEDLRQLKAASRASHEQKDAG
jgi:uncharacterized membrane protein YqjE